MKYIPLAASDLKIDDIDGIPALTLTRYETGETATYQLLPDAVTTIVSALIGVAVPPDGVTWGVVKTFPRGDRKGPATPRSEVDTPWDDAAPLTFGEKEAPHLSFSGPVRMDDRPIRRGVVAGEEYPEYYTPEQVRQRDAMAASCDPASVVVGPDRISFRQGGTIVVLSRHPDGRWDMNGHRTTEAV